MTLGEVQAALCARGSDERLFASYMGSIVPDGRLVLQGDWGLSRLRQTLLQAIDANVPARLVLSLFVLTPTPEELAKIDARAEALRRALAAASAAEGRGEEKEEEEEKEEGEKEEGGGEDGGEGEQMEAAADVAGATAFGRASVILIWWSVARRGASAGSCVPRSFMRVLQGDTEWHSHKRAHRPGHAHPEVVGVLVLALASVPRERAALLWEEAATIHARGSASAARGQTPTAAYKS
jgi:hypothetical protein